MMKSIAHNIISFPVKVMMWPIQKIAMKFGKEGIAKASANIASNTFSGVLGTLVVTAMGIGGVRAYHTFDDPWSQTLPAPCAEYTTCIVVAALQGDPEGSQTDHVVSALEKLFLDELMGEAKVEIQTIPIRLDRRLVGNSIENRKVAEKNAMEWLQNQNADILIYGRVAVEDQFLRLRIISIEGTSYGDYGLAGEASGIIILPVSFSEELSAVFLGVLQNRAFSIFTNGDDIKAHEFLHEKLMPLISNPPESLSVELVAKIHSVYAANLFIKSQKNDNQADLENAIEAMQTAINLTTSEKNSLELATKYMLLATMLEKKISPKTNPGGFIGQTEILEQIADAYRATLNEEFMKNDIELYGTMQINLSSTLLKLSVSTSSESIVDESIEASQIALSIFMQDNPKHAASRVLATLWYASALDRKADLTNSESLSFEALNILKELQKTSKGIGNNPAASAAELQKLIEHMETNLSVLTTQ